ncbi:MAG TPA: ATPase [Prolixibacteraceae bacterium]|jgi:DNA helicase HerA-like ATPase|nr:ATPase [Prolixibacteraceae bacterium]
MSIEKFKEQIQTSFSFAGKSLLIGGAVYEGKVIPGLNVRLPLSTVNRHGLIAGATGTGKTKSIQRLAESLSEQGVNVLLMDIKGDISGISKPGIDNPKIKERMNLIGAPWSPTEYTTELMTISDEKGLRMRATVSEFGPVLFSKILELNENQEGSIAIVFKYCDDKRWPLLDIKDFRAVLQHLSEGEGKEEIEKNYGSISPASSGVIMRRLLELEQQGGDKFFGEKSFEVEDLLQIDKSGKAYINILRLTDIQDSPKLFSSFMLCLLAEIYSKFPEIGDQGDPKLVIFIDEAHLIFTEASKALMQQLETIIKLIRSKGVGIYFCTQAPTDIPDSILSQLGTKIQHALRAFTAKDRKDIKLVAENFPTSEYYRTDQVITELGIGEALVTVLNEKGIPTPLVYTLMCAPQSRMDILTPEEQEEKVKSSRLAGIYNEEIDRESAYEILNKKITSSIQKDDSSENKKNETNTDLNIGGTIEKIANSSITRTIVREVARGLFGILIGNTRRTSSRR